MAQYWEMDLYYAADSRFGLFGWRRFLPGSEDLERTTYHGRPVYKKTVITDSYESGASGTVALYYSEDHERMDRVISLKDPDLITYDARLMGEPEDDDDEPDPEDADAWTQEAS